MCQHSAARTIRARLIGERRPGNDRPASCSEKAETRRVSYRAKETKAVCFPWRGEHRRACVRPAEVL
jgi:hypothetical protein